MPEINEMKTLLAVEEPITYASWSDNTYNEYTVENISDSGSAIVITFTPESNNWQKPGHNLLSVNGVSVISHGNTAGSYKIGSLNVEAKFTACAITVVIDPLTGATSIADSYGRRSTANVGSIADSFVLKINQNNTNGWTLASLVVEQYTKTALLTVGRTAYAGWAYNTFNEYLVNTNGTGGDITIIFTPERNNWSSPGNNLLSVNGVSLITTGSNGSYKLGSTAVAADFTAYVITATIDVATGDVALVDAQGHKGFINVGAIGDSFTLKINQAQNNSWELSSLVVYQDKLAQHTCDVTSWGDWDNDCGLRKRTCSECTKTERKAISKIDPNKNLLALGDSLTYALNTPNTINDSWAWTLAASLGMLVDTPEDQHFYYVNKAVAGSEAYHWYSILTGEAAPNGNTYTPADLIDAGLKYDPSFDKAAMTAAIENASVVAFTLGTNDMSKGYLAYRTPEQIHTAIVGFIDAIHKINPKAVVVMVGCAYGLLNTAGANTFAGSLPHFVKLNSLMTETLNSENYNDFTYYIDISATLLNPIMIGCDRVHPTGYGHSLIAEEVIKTVKGSAIFDNIIKYGSKRLGLIDGQTATLNCKGTRAIDDIIISGKCRVSYDGDSIANITEKDGVATLNCDGKMMASDVVITTPSVSGGAECEHSWEVTYTWPTLYELRFGSGIVTATGRCRESECNAEKIESVKAERESTRTEACTKYYRFKATFPSLGSAYYNNGQEFSYTSHTKEEAVRENYIPTSCTEPGSWDVVVYCAVCKEELSRKAVTTEATGHTWNEAYCGNYATCQTCGEKATTPGPHYYVKPTNYSCETDLRQCSYCKKYEDTPRGHTHPTNWKPCIENEYCTYCGEMIQPATYVHVYADATCTTPETCIMCGATKDPALGHDWEQIGGQIGGLHKYKCKRCGFTSAVIPDSH